MEKQQCQDNIEDTYNKSFVKEIDNFYERMKNMSPIEFKGVLNPIFASLGLSDYSHLFYENFSPSATVGILHNILKNRPMSNGTSRT